MVLLLLGHGLWFWILSSLLYFQSWLFPLLWNKDNKNVISTLLQVHRQTLASSWINTLRHRLTQQQQRHFKINLIDRRFFSFWPRFTWPWRRAAGHNDSGKQMHNRKWCFFSYIERWSGRGGLRLRESKQFHVTGILTKRIPLLSVFHQIKMVALPPVFIG